MAVNISTTAKYCGVFHDLNRFELLWTSENDGETIRKAVAEKLPVIISDLPAYELVGKLYELGIPGLR